MAKRKAKAKRSLASLPKGLPTKSSDTNPFEVTKRQRRPKHDVVNRFSTSSQKPKPSKLAESLQRRQAQLRASLKSSRKVNSFVDRRIGEYTMSPEEQVLARLVKERSLRSKRTSKYSLEDDDEQLTHKGKSIDKMNHLDHVILSSDEEDGGDLDAVDTELHFGGGSERSSNPYGPASDGAADMAKLYSQRKTDLDDLIKRRKLMKAEKMQSKEKQLEIFESMDEGFKQLSELLQFRDKEKERKIQLEKKQAGTWSEEDKEMADWDKEMKTYLFERKVKATDRTKTPEEIAKEEAERLHELETRRLARMNGDFEDDDLSDISDEDEAKSKKRRVSKKRKASVGPESLEDYDSEKNEDQLKVKFTADGLVYVDKEGNLIKKVGDDSDDNQGEESSESEEEANRDEDDEPKIELDVKRSLTLTVGTRVFGNYRAKKQFDEQEAWYEGTITQVHVDKAGNTTYDVEYDDGDFEENMEPENVRAVKRSTKEREKEAIDKESALSAKRKRQKAKQKARSEMPYVFEVPTTLEALHEMIGNFASTGREASLIVERIHASNSVRLSRKNEEKMQNFYDVVLRRFIAVGDAVYTSGRGGDELDRYEQLDSLTRTLYAMSQDAPETTAAVWGRRLGVLQNAHAKRLRDSEFVQEEERADDDEITAWPSTGTLFLLRALGHIFPATDRRHQVMTPAMLLIGQMVAQTPVLSVHDLVMGLFCTGLLIEYSREAKRVVPEALAFLCGVIRLFSNTTDDSPIPTMKQVDSNSLIAAVKDYTGEVCPKLSPEKEAIIDLRVPVAILCSALQLIDAYADALGGSLNFAESEAFSEIIKALLSLSRTKQAIPKIITTRVTATASKLSQLVKNAARPPLARRAAPKVESAVPSLAPRLQDPDRFKSLSTSNKTMEARREWKREKKAVARELRLDASMVEQERRHTQDSIQNKVRAKRLKNFAWLEGEQAAMNNQVRQGGGLLSGGGMGAARAKASTGKLGIKKGGKF